MMDMKALLVGCLWCDVWCGGQCFVCSKGSKSLIFFGWVKCDKSNNCIQRDWRDQSLARCRGWGPKTSVTPPSFPLWSTEWSPPLPGLACCPPAGRPPQPTHVISFQSDLSYWGGATAQQHNSTTAQGLISHPSLHWHISHNYSKHGQPLILTIIKALIGSK